MAAANFAVSSALPPPMPMTASARCSRASRAVSAMPESWGLASTLPNTAQTASSRSLSFSASGAKCLPQAITQR